MEQSGHFHAVGFYRDDASLCGIVAAFLTEGFRVQSPGLVIAPRALGDALRVQMRAQQVDVDALIAAGDLVMLDAQETLAQFMRDGMPDAALFHAIMIPVMKQICRGHKDCTIRAFGSMVDVLWQAGQHTAAIKLEMLWNSLAATEDFSLLCGYSMGSFYKDAGFAEVCQQHSHVVELGASGVGFNGAQDNLPQQPAIH